MDAAYIQQGEWTCRSIQSVAAMGRFSSDRTVAEYAADIWHIESHPFVPPGPHMPPGHVAPPVVPGIPRRTSVNEGVYY